MGVKIVFSFVCCLMTWMTVTVNCAQNANNNDQGPSLVLEPPHEVAFANTIGTKLDCKATGSPMPSVNWAHTDRSKVQPVEGLREILPNGTIVFKPFSAEQYRPDVHATSYICMANNSVGTIVSNEIQLRGVVLQPYDLQVYDSFTIEGNTAVFKCHVPKILGDYISVSGWIKNDNLLIQTSNSDTSTEKYTISSNGELHISDVAISESGSQYKCKTTHKLSNESLISRNGGRLFVTAPHGNVPVKILDMQAVVEVELGKNAIVACVAQGYPVPQISWFRKQSDGNIEKITGRNRRTKIAKSSLVITKVEVSDGGSYICEASSTIGRDEAEIVLNVIEPLNVVMLPAVRVANNKESATFHCKASVSAKATFSWLHDARIISDETSSTLTIASAEAADKGMYQCIVTDNGKTIQASSELRLSGIPPKFISTFEEITLQPGGTVTLTCTAMGFPTPDIRWHLDEVLLFDGSNTKITQKSAETAWQTSSTITMNNVKVEQGGLYSCTAVNSVGIDQYLARVNVHGPVKSRNVSPKVVVAGTDALLNCPFYGYPFGKIGWKKNEENLPTSFKQAVFNNGTLKIQSVQKPLDLGVYVCSVSTPNGQFVQSSLEVNIVAAPKIVPFWFQDELLREGMRARLQCVVSEGDLPLTITWMKDNLPLPQHSADPTTNVRVLDDFSSILTIGSISPRHNGNYTCVASNNAASVTHTAQLSVNVQPQIIPFAFLDDQFYKGMRAHITCAVSQGDMPISFEWLKDDHNIQSDLNISIRNYDRHASTLSVENVMSRHSGNYTCAATNHAATVTYTAALLVRVSPKIVPFSFQDLQYEGSTARLVCGLLEGDFPVQFFWLKNGLPIISSLNGPVVSVHNFEGVSSILTIKNVKVEHAGNYTCVAQNRVAFAKHTAILAVNVAPKIVPFSFQGEHLFEGAVARITCVVYQGDLPLTIRWLKDGAEIAGGVSNANVHQIDDYTSILTIDNVRIGHAGNYTCLAMNHADATSHSAVLSVNVPPKIVPFAFQGEHSHEGNLARVSCVISRGDLPLNIHWEKDEQAIATNLGVTVRSFDEHSSILSIESVTTRHNGRYTCVATNAAGMANYSAEIIVQVPPRWIQKPRDASALNGQEVMLHCQAEGHPKPSISWMHSIDMTEGSRSNILNGLKTHIFPNGSLLIRDVDSESAGYYSCQASNGIGYGLAAMAKIQLQAPPSFKMGVKTVYCSLDEKCKLECDSEGDSPMTVLWYKDEELLRDTTATRYRLESVNSVSGVVSRLEVPSALRQDNGKFYCVVENPHGKGNVTVNLIIQEIPDAPGEISISEIESRQLNVSWKMPFDGHDPINKFVIQYIPEAGIWSNAGIKEILGAFTAGTVTDLQPATKYLFRVYAENSKGKSRASQIAEGITVGEAPSAVPKNVRVTSKNDNTLTVTWSVAQDELGNGRIMGYYVGYKEEDKNEPYNFKTLMSSQSETSDHAINIVNLSKFTKYAVVVQAYNEQGKGPLSDPVIAMTSEGVPSTAPIDVRCTTLTSQSIHAAWASPHAKDINGILAGYKVIYRAASGWYENESHLSNTTAPFVTLLNLEKYTNYSIQLSAVTKAGDGPYSDSVYCKTLDDVPDAPADIKVLQISSTSVLLTWKHPAKPNGITKNFNVFIRDVKNGNDFARNTLPAQLNQLEMPALKEGHEYEFWVTAVNVVGEGPSSTVVTASPRGPTVPARVVPFNEMLTIPWKSDVALSCQAVGVPLPERKWYHRKQLINDGDRVFVTPTGSLVIKMISEHESGDYKCVVSNTFNEDQVAYIVNVQVPPSPPTIEVVQTTFSSIEIKWTISKSSSGRVKGYVLRVRREFGEWKEITLDHDVASYRLNGLECGTKYEITMAAFNVIGMGDKSQPLLIATNGSVPTAPATTDFIEKTSTSVSISLNAWKSNSCLILYFVVEYKAKTSTDWIVASNNLKPERGRLVIRDLQPASLYRLRIVAHNSAGPSSADYDFATYTLTGEQISADVMQQDEVQNSYSTATVNLWVVVTIILSILLVIGALALVCLIVRRKNGERNAVDKGARLSCASSDSKHQESFAYSQRNTLSRPHTQFGTMSSAGCQDDLVPYATCQLADHMNPFLHPQACSPSLARQMEMQGRVIFNNGGNMGTTIVFPGMTSNMPCCSESPTQQIYSNADHKPN